MILLNGIHQVFICVIDSRNVQGISLGIGGPEDNDAVKFVFFSEVGDILTNELKMDVFVLSFK